MLTLQSNTLTSYVTISSSTREPSSKETFSNHKFRHPHCVYNKLDWSLYTCLTKLYGGRDV